MKFAYLELCLNSIFINEHPDQSLHCFNWALTQENLSSGFANNEGADQSAPLRRLISAFVIRSLESNIYR